LSINTENKIKNHTELNIKILGTKTGLTIKDKMNKIVGVKIIRIAMSRHFTDLFLIKKNDRRTKL